MAPGRKTNPWNDKRFDGVMVTAPDLLDLVEKMGGAAAVTQKGKWSEVFRILTNNAGGNKQKRSTVVKTWHEELINTRQYREMHGIGNDVGDLNDAGNNGIAHEVRQVEGACGIVRRIVLGPAITGGNFLTIFFCQCGDCRF